jgi:hypothetical protein
MNLELAAVVEIEEQITCRELLVPFISEFLSSCLISKNFT